MKHKIIGLLLLAGLIVPACIDDTNPLETHPVQPTAGSDAELDIEESDAGSDDGGCKPNCVGKQCGPDGCGGVCAECADGKTCNDNGKCIEVECEPACEEGQECGDDGCGGTCGSGCAGGEACTTEGQCVVVDCGVLCTELGRDCGYIPTEDPKLPTCDCGTCDDGNSCSLDECLENGTCSHTQLDDGEECDDGDNCTVDDSCMDGVCESGEPKNCADESLCTEDYCEDGACYHAEKACEDENPCTTDSCDPLTGDCIFDAVENGTPCDGADVPCTDYACQEGTCTPFPTESPEGDCICTTDDECNLTWGTENNLCDGIWTCHKDPDENAEGTCMLDSSTIVDCSDLNDACNEGTCIPESGDCEKTPFNENGSCNDGNQCTDDDSCKEGSCSGVEKDCAAFTDACNDAMCLPDTGECEQTPINNGGACDDSDACTEADTCDGGDCTGTQMTCDDDNPCTDNTCVSSSGCLFQANDENMCDDGNACTDNDTCTDGECAGAEIVCDDGNLCTSDSCLPDSGCSFTPIQCSDDNECTADSCIPESGCDFPKAQDGTECGEPDSNWTCVDGTCGEPQGS